MLPLLRIEPVKDEKSCRRYLIEIYYPADAEAPYVTTEPRYHTSAAAENDTIAIIAPIANRERAD
jgi:hypothetical protein